MSTGNGSTFVREQSRHDDSRRQPVPYDVHPLDEVAAQPRSAVVQSIGLDESSVAAFAGAPNGGKTAIAIDLALHVAAGTSWFGLKVSGGPVVYFAAEAPGSVAMRARAAQQRKFPGRRLPFYLVTDAPGLGGELSTAADTESVIATIRVVESTEGQPVKVAIIDTLASCLGDGDENGSGMTLLVGAAKRIAHETGALVLIVHHPSKGDASGLRGHGSLSAAADTIVIITVDDVTGIRTATLTKSRDTATGLQLSYELEAVALAEPDSFGDPRTTIIVRQVSQTGQRRPRPGGKAQLKLLDELERRHRIGETAWDEATIREAGRQIGLHRNSAGTALAGLRQAGFLIGSPAHVTLKFPPEERT